MCPSNLLACCVSLILSLAAPLGASATDWPTYLGNNQRTGTTDARLATPLQQRWVYSSSAAIRQAWSGAEGRTVEGRDLFDRVTFDDALQVAVVEGRVYFGSSVDHAIHCLDASTGKSLWQYVTGAPIRLAPSVVDGRVYVGSDDGYAYCLDSTDGRLIWSLRLGPADEWMIGRGEMISRWPVRTSIAVAEGIAYFGAGIFPHENVYLYAARAEDGQVVWKNDGISHRDAGREDLSPQGYLMVAKDKLYAPSGRARPKGVDRSTGKVSSAGATSLKLSAGMLAGTCGLIVDDRLHTYSLGSRMAGSSQQTFATTGGSLARFDQKAYHGVTAARDRLQGKLRSWFGKFRKQEIDEETYKQETDKVRREIEDLSDKGIDWRSPCKANSALIIAGDLVFVGGENEVLAFQRSDGKQVWQAAVEGEANGLAAVTGQLLVSTSTGKIYCFAAEAPTAPTTTADTVGTNPEIDVSDAWSTVYEKAVADILANTGTTRGFCLIVGSETGRLAEELAKRSELKIYGVESDAAKVAESRRRLARAGLYGHRVTIHETPPGIIPYSNYFANLVVSDTLLRTGEFPADPAEVARHLKPAGGVICMGRPAGTPGDDLSLDQRKAWLSKMDLHQQSEIAAHGSWTTLTRGTLPGAGNWSHQYAEPGNTTSSGDKLVKGGLGVLWYGDPGPGKMTNRHQGAVGPLVVDGRMFVQGNDSLLAYDAYNGLQLWEVPNPKAIRTGVFQNRSPGNLAAVGQSLFHKVRQEVIEHDAATGKVKRTFRLPESVDKKTNEWGYMAVRDGRLIGTATMRDVVRQQFRRRGDPGAAASDTIFAFNVESGKHLWSHRGNTIDFQTIALGPDRVYYIDSSITGEQRADMLRQDKEALKELTGDERRRAEQRIKHLDARLAVALDAGTGEQLWSRPVDVTDCSEIGIGGGKLTMMFHNNVLILCGANANGHFWKQFMAGEFSKRRIVALYALDGYKMWAKDANYRHRPIIVGDRVIAEPWAYDLTTGRQLTREHPLTGQQVPWSFMRPGHHCGMLTACDNLLMFRSGYTAFYDLNADAGTRHIAGHRLGCWINAIPTNGLVVIPEASAGCICMFSIASTLVMEPRPPRRPWGLYSGVGAKMPIKRVALNLGAPGDRRDRSGKLWLAYPRPVPNPRLETGLDLKLRFETAFAPGGGFVADEGELPAENASDLAWVASSGARGLTRCVIPLRGKDDGSGTYRLRLYLVGANAADETDRSFDVVVQGTVAQATVVPPAVVPPAVVPRGSGATDGGVGTAAMSIHTIDAIVVKDRLVIEIKAKDAKATLDQLPTIAGLEVISAEVGEP